MEYPAHNNKRRYFGSLDLQEYHNCQFFREIKYIHRSISFKIISSVFFKNISKHYRLIHGFQDNVNCVIEISKCHLIFISHSVMAKA